MDSAGNLKLHSFDLADQDVAALAQIREKLELPSNALAVRLAIRSLAKRLGDPKILAGSNSPNAGPVTKEALRLGGTEVDRGKP